MCFHSDLDVSAVHAAIFAINEVIDKGNAESTMVALRNPNALLRNTQTPLAQTYQDTLSQAKRKKEHQASARVIILDFFRRSFESCYIITKATNVN